MANKPKMVVEVETRTSEDAVPLQSLEIPSSRAIRRRPSDEKNIFHRPYSHQTFSRSILLYKDVAIKIYVWAMDVNWPK